MPSPTEITAKQLYRLVGTPDQPVLIDICIEEDFCADPHLVPGAFRWPHTEIEALASQLAGHRVVVICQKGLKLSQGAAALLRTCGVKAQTLQGGALGWRQAGFPMVPASALPEHERGQASLWVTRHRPKIDRIACPWLIRRFVDRNARFLFVAPSEVTAVAEKFGATPFDVADVKFTHRRKGCTFDTMLEEFALSSPALSTLASIVRAADTDRPDLAPEAKGLLAVSFGLSAMHRDDLSQLEAGMVVYDALYAWARDAQTETHDWTPEAAAEVS